MKMDNNPIRFSVCIPNFNYEGYIGRTIQSVLDQTYPELEIIIVDNASTDRSWDTIQTYVTKDSRVKAYRNSYNIGFAPNLDKAAQYAENEYIVVLSSDDLMMPDALNEYKNILEQLDTQNRDKILLG